MDAHLVDKRLAWIEAACERLRRLAVPDRIATDELPGTSSCIAILTSIRRSCARCW